MTPKISRISLLMVCNWVVFVLLYATEFFNAYIFKVVSVSISKLPFPMTIRSLLLVLWMIVPQTLIFTILNYYFFKIPTRKFVITQLLFASSVVLVLFIVFFLV